MVTRSVSPQMECVDGVLYYVRDLCPFPHSVSSSVENETTVLSNDEVCVLDD